MTTLRGMTAVLFLSLAGCSGGGATGSCTLPDRAPQILNQVQPDVPAMAQQQGIAGEVIVRVTVDASGAVTSATIASSPSAILNQAALSAARASTYQAGLQDCVPGGSLNVRFEFTAPAVGVRF